MKAACPNPLLVGSYVDPAGRQLLPLSEAESIRIEWFYRRVFDTFGLPSRSRVLLVTKFEDAAMTMPLDSMLIADGFVPAYAEATAFDAARVEAFVRQLSPRAVIGIDSSVLAGLQGLGHDPAALFQDRIVWASDEDAYQRLTGGKHILLRRWMPVGPAPAMECHAGGGLHIDDREWLVDQQGDEILLSSRLPRSLAFKRISTGVHATIERALCRCGISGSRIKPLA